MGLSSAIVDSLYFFRKPTEVEAIAIASEYSYDARLLTYSICLSCTLLSILRANNLSPRNVRSIIQQALITFVFFIECKSLYRLVIAIYS